MTQEKSTALALPSSFDEISDMAKAFVQSGMFTDVKALSQAIVKIQAGRELGLPPVYSMQNINLIRNRLTTSANTMAMLVKRSEIYDYRIKEHNEKVCTISFYQKDGAKWVEVGISSFSIEDAKRADLLKPDSGWMKYPRAMLFSRAISQGARIYCPDAICGVYTDEEIRSIPPRPEDFNTVSVDTTTGEVIETRDPIGDAAKAKMATETTPQTTESTASSTETESSSEVVGVTIMITPKDIYDFVKAKKPSLKTPKNVEDYLTGVLHIDLARLGIDPAIVLSEVQAIKEWK